MIIKNKKTFENVLRKHGLFADGFYADIERAISENYVGIYNDRFEVETGRRNKRGDVEVLVFSALNRNEFNADDEVVNDLTVHFDGIY